MDNARGGLRGLRATPSPALFDLARAAYGIDCGDDAVDLGGSSNLNLLVGARKPDDQRYVLRVYRPYVTPDRLRDINRARHALCAGGVPSADILPTRDGRQWMQCENRLVEVERYIDHDAHMDNWEDLERALPWLGRIHAILQTVGSSEAGAQPLFANYIQAADVLAHTQRAARRMRGWNPSAVELGLANEAETLARLLARAEPPLVKQLPGQLVHGDFWNNNVLLRAGRVVLVADFDFMGVRPRIDDLALTLYFACMKFYPGPVSDAQLGPLRRLLDAYDSGADQPLTSRERAALPLALARQPLWSIGGWVATLDDEETARQHAAGSVAEIAWALRLIADLKRWQAALA